MGVVEHTENLLRDIADVDDAVVVEQRQVRSGIAIEGRVGQGDLELRLGIDARVICLFDPHTDGCGKIAVKLLSLLHEETSPATRHEGQKTATGRLGVAGATRFFF